MWRRERERERGVKIVEKGIGNTEREKPGMTLINTSKKCVRLLSGKRLKKNNNNAKKNI